MQKYLIIVIFLFCTSIFLPFIDARCVGGGIDCGSPPYLNFKTLDGINPDKVTVDTQYVISHNVRNYYKVFLPCQEIQTFDAISLGEYNSTIPIEKCVSGNKWIFDERTDILLSLPVVVLLQVHDEDGITQYLGWIEAEVLPNEDKTFQFSWMPSKPGQHNLTIFTWDGLDNPNPLDSTISLIVNVTEN